MLSSPVMLLPGYILIIGFTVCIHEALHFLPALPMGRLPKIRFQYWVVPVVYYANNGKNYQNLFISCLPTVVLVPVGLLASGDDPYTVFFRIMCMSNAFNILPVTSDGEVVMLSILKIVRGK